VVEAYRGGASQPASRSSSKLARDGMSTHAPPSVHRPPGSGAHQPAPRLGLSIGM